MSQIPEISVLIPAYNAARTIRAALWSVINQSFENTEILIYLDGCDDETEVIVHSFEDRRIRCIKSNENRGIVHARNTLMREAKGKYLAWLDADDIALPGRFAAAYEFLEVHPQIMVLGTWSEVRNSREIRAVKWPGNPKIIDAWMLFRNPLVHSSVMLRNQNFQMDPHMEYLEDYDLYSRFLGKEAVAVYPELLCSYLEDDEKNRISKYLKYNFTGKLERIMKRNFDLLQLNPGLNEIALLRDFLRGTKILKKDEIRQLFVFFLKVKKQNGVLQIFDKNAMDAVVSFQILRMLQYDTSMAVKILFYFLRSPLSLFRAVQARPGYVKIRKRG